jgi:hypothetical protein
MLIDNYYSSYKDRPSIKKDELTNYYTLKYPKSKDTQLYYSLIESMYNITINNKLVVTDLIEQLIEQYSANMIVDKLLPVLEGQKYGIVHTVADDVDIYLKKLREPPEELKELEPCDTKLAELVQQDRIDGLLWPHPKLNQSVGGLKGGRNGLIYAFVDSGKTSFGIQACGNFLIQINHDPDACIVYAGNEESADRVKFRLAQAMMGHAGRWFHHPQNLRAAQIELSKHKFNQIKIFDGINHIKQIERLLDNHEPKIMFIDQGTKVAVPGHVTGEVGTGQILFGQYRDLAREFECDIISLAQAAAVAENKEWLTVADLYGSKVAIPGELDYMIGIGRKISDDTKLDIRYFNVPKNKGPTIRYMAHFDEPRCRMTQV